MVKLENNEDMMILAIKIHKAVKAPVKLFNELLKKERINNYSIILTESEFPDYGNFLKKQKRRSDMLVDIDPEKRLYGFICPETEANGGYYFFKRLSDELYRKEEYEIKATVLSVARVEDDIWNSVIEVIDAYIELKFNDKPQDIVLKALK
jgi:hypothetical protein